MHLLNVIILLITVVFRASPSLQQWAYATSVLVLLAGAALADVERPAAKRPARPQTHRVDRSLRRRRRLLPGDDRPHGADQPLGPDDRAVLRRRDSHQLVRLALDSLHRAAIRRLRIRRRRVATTLGRTVPIGHKSPRAPPPGPRSHWPRSARSCSATIASTRPRRSSSSKSCSATRATSIRSRS